MRSLDEMLASSLWSRELPPEHLQRVRAAVVVRDFAAGAYVCHKGEPAGQAGERVPFGKGSHVHRGARRFLVRGRFGAQSRAPQVRLPVTATGKIQKFMLRAKAKAL